MKNPVMTASGTFGYGEEFADFIDLERIGGIIVKGTTLHKREGNPYPRMAETPSGMLNAVGLQNKGVHYFVEHIYPRIKDIRTNMIVNVSGSAIEDYAETASIMIVNVSGSAIEDYVETASIINELDKIPAIELNISCPNVKQGGMAFGVTAKGAEEVVKAVRQVYKKTLIVKLSPNVTDITEIARAAENGGADSVSLINTLLGMAINAEKRRPVLSTVTGGMSGAAVKPIALRMVWHGVAGGQGGKNTRHRPGRHHELARCRGIPAGRGYSHPDRYGQLHRSDGYGQSGRGHRRLPEPARIQVCNGHYRCTGGITSDRCTPFATEDNKKGHQPTDVLFFYIYMFVLFSQQVGTQPAGPFDGLLQLPFLNLRLVSGK